MTQTGKKPCYIFTQGKRKQAFRTSELGCANWSGWDKEVRLLTLSEANNINDGDMYN